MWYVIHFKVLTMCCLFISFSALTTKLYKKTCVVTLRSPPYYLRLTPPLRHLSPFENYLQVRILFCYFYICYKNYILS